MSPRISLLAVSAFALASSFPATAQERLGWDCASGEQFKVMISGDRQSAVIREYNAGRLEAHGFLKCSDLVRGSMTMGLSAFARCVFTTTEEAAPLRQLPFVPARVDDLSREFQVTLLENATTGTQLFARISKRAFGAMRVIDTVECSERNPNPIE